MVLLHKAGAKYLIENYREISLVSVVSKLFERLLCSRIQSWVEERNSLADEQSGFRPGRRTEDNLFMLSEITSARSRKGLPTCLSFWDIATAYDVVLRDQLFVSMHEHGIRGRVWLLIRSCYDSVLRRVSIGASVSDPYDLERGVAQGAVLSPLLYDIYINDLLIRIRSVDSGVSVGGAPISSFALADDIVTFGADPAVLQRQMDVGSSVAQERGFSYKASKCGVMLVGRGSAVSSVAPDPSVLRLKLGNAVVPVVQQYKYLGIPFTGKRGWSVAVADIIRRAERQVRILHARGCVRDAFVPVVSRRLFIAVVRPILEYACTVWHPTAKQSAKLESLQASFARRALGLPSSCNSMCAIGELGLEPLWARRDKLRLLYWGYLTLLPRSRLLSKVFHATLDELALRATATGSSLVLYRPLLAKYGMADLWETRSSEVNIVAWKKVISRKISSFVLRERARLAVSSASLSFFSLVSPLAKAPSGSEVSSNFLGHWLKRLLRTNSLPLSSVLGKFAGWERARTLCIGCDSDEVEDVHHFLHCPALRVVWLELISQLGAALSASRFSDRGAVLRVIGGADRAASSALLLGCPILPVSLLKIRDESLLVIDRVVCLFLKQCWKQRVSWYGGIPSLGPGSALVISPGVWPGVKSR